MTSLLFLWNIIYVGDRILTSQAKAAAVSYHISYFFLMKQDPLGRLDGSGGKILSRNWGDASSVPGSATGSLYYLE